MKTNSQLSTTESKNKTKLKNKLSKQLEQEQNHGYGDFGGSSVGRWKGENGGKGTEIKKYKLVRTE